MLLMAVVALAGLSGTPKAEAQQAGITGNIPSDGGVAVVIWSGGSVEELKTAAAGQGCDVESVWVTVDGDFVGFSFGVPEFVNAGFTESVGASLPTMALLLVCSETTVETLSFRIDFIDVGQGDATLITVGGERLLIDGGRSGTRIEERLTALGVTDLDAILSTHPDADHIAGLNRVLELFGVERIYLNGGTSDTQTFLTYIALVQAEGADVVTVARGDGIALGGLTLEVLHPASITGESNDDSAVVQLSCGAIDVLLMGDATMTSEASLVAASALDDVDVLKVGHHGSNTSSGSAFLDVVVPEHAVISAGLDNQYGHPHDEVVAALEASGAAIYLTDTTAGDDTVSMSSDCESVTFDELAASGQVAGSESLP